MGHATPPSCRTAETPLVGGSMNHVDNFLKAVLLRDVDGISTDTLRRIATTYGTGTFGSADGPGRAGAGAPWAAAAT